MKLVIYRDDDIKTYRLALVYRQSSHKRLKLVKYNFKKYDLVLLPYFVHKKREDFDLFVDSVRSTYPWLLHD
jgi:hypothetical protein